ncbi:type II secretion system protein N [Metapseudomonas otitidis]|uniref:type II secretion system protein N n=1 Tax=Metapseudomonas otitidis TaxID=319939 RepID=UPI0013F61435|nr:type II secretion system protein N [Pseudomonas otitidis]
MHWTRQPDPAALVQGAAILATLAGLATWYLLLSDPPPLEARASSTVAPQVAVPEQPARWFARRSDSVTLQVTGLFAGPRGRVAILAVDGGSPQPFLVGERLAEGVWLEAIEPDAVVIRRGERRERLAIPRLARGPELPDLR